MRASSIYIFYYIFGYVNIYVCMYIYSLYFIPSFFLSFYVRHGNSGLLQNLVFNWQNIQVGQRSNEHHQEGMIYCHRGGYMMVWILYFPFLRWTLLLCLCEMYLQLVPWKHKTDTFWLTIDCVPNPLLCTEPEIPKSSSSAGSGWHWMGDGKTEEPCSCQYHPSRWCFTHSAAVGLHLKLV